MPVYNGFCGPSNPLQAYMADRERLVNWYVEQVDSPAAPTSAMLLPTPGQTAYITTTDVGVRAITSEIQGRVFAVVGTGLWELFATKTATKRGTVAQDNYPATISYNGITGGQLFITSGGNGYCYVLATNVLTQVLTNESTMGGMKDGFFLSFNIINGKVLVSDLNDGMTWDPLVYFQRSIAPDPWQAMVVGNPELWFVGDQTGEAWYNTGASPQPFAPIPGAFFQYGTKAPFSVTMAGSTLVWLSHTKDGAGQVVAARGYSPQPISNYAVDTAIASYDRDSTIEDCETLVYQQDGHTFACVHFPSANSTWCVDMSTGQWHERGSWNIDESRYDVWHPRVHAHAFGKHLVGERATGVISEMDVTLGLEADGSAIRRMRIGPPLWAAQRQGIVIARLDLIMDTGLGLSSGQGSDPMVMMRSTGDSRRWSSERQCSAGPMGHYGRRVFWTRCGSSNRVWFPEITVSDPIPWRLCGAEVQGSGFNTLAKAS